MPPRSISRHGMKRGHDPVEERSCHTFPLELGAHGDRLDGLVHKHIVRFPQGDVGTAFTGTWIESDASGPSS